MMQQNLMKNYGHHQLIQTDRLPNVSLFRSIIRESIEHERKKIAIFLVPKKWLRNWSLSISTHHYYHHHRRRCHLRMICGRLMAFDAFVNSSISLSIFFSASVPMCDRCRPCVRPSLCYTFFYDAFNKKIKNSRPTVNCPYA